MPKVSITMLDNWHYKHQKSGILNAKIWCVKCHFRHFKCQKLFLKLTPTLDVEEFLDMNYWGWSQLSCRNTYIWTVNGEHLKIVKFLIHKKIVKSCTFTVANIKKPLKSYLTNYFSIYTTWSKLQTIIFQVKMQAII